MAVAVPAPDNGFMRTVPAPTAEARLRADEAAARAGLEVRELVTARDLALASELFDDIWSRPNGQSLLPGELLRAMTHAGNYAAGAFDSGRLAGAIVGFWGKDGRGWHLHSHVLGVVRECRGRNVGYALKQHQRAWTLERGVTTVTWTFDPLVSRNAYFNLTKLGADAGEYLENFYGRMDDAINGAEETDRLLIVWNLSSPKAAGAAAGAPPRPSVDGAGVALGLGDESEPVVRRTTSQRILVATPRDIVKLRRANPALATEWRLALRRVLGGVMRDGYRAEGFDPSGWYVLRRT